MGKDLHLYRTTQCLHTEFEDTHPRVDLYSETYSEWLEERYASLCLAMVEGIAENLVEEE